MALGAQAGVHSRGRSFCLERKVASWAERVEARLEKRLRAFGFEKAQEPSTKTHGAVARLNGGGTGSVHHNHFNRFRSVESFGQSWSRRNSRMSDLGHCPLCAQQFLVKSQGPFPRHPQWTDPLYYPSKDTMALQSPDRHLALCMWCNLSMTDKASIRGERISWSYAISKMAFVPQLSVPQNGMECRMIQNSQSCVIDKHINESQHNMPQGKHCEFSFFFFFGMPAINQGKWTPAKR